MRFLKHLALTSVLILGIIITIKPTAGAETSSAAGNSDLVKQVQHKLSTLPFYGVFDDLQFKVTGNEVTLTGNVVSEHDQTKYDAQRVVESIPGVSKVTNNIEVLPISSLDDRIRRAEYRTVFSQSDLGRYTEGAIPQVHIIVKNGHVFLEGTVINQMDKTVAGLVANSVSGVFSVTNDLRVG